jgi:hypothetical protein
MWLDGDGIASNVSALLNEYSKVYVILFSQSRKLLIRVGASVAQ